MDYLRKQDGLLTETGRSIDGNWMLSSQKLDDLLTETVWSIDGNWTVIDGKSAVYLWKQCIKFSSFWWPENGIFAEF